MNSIAIAGYVLMDPEIKQINDTRVAKMRVAVKFAGPRKDGGREDGIWTVEAWGKQADFVEKFIVKGSGVTVSGELLQDRFNDKETGKAREITYISANKVGFPPKSDGGAKAGGGSSSSGSSEGSGSSGGGSSSASDDYDPYNV